MTHVETPLDPIAASENALDGKAQADRAFTSCAANIPRHSARRGCAPMAFPASARPAGSSAASSSRSTMCAPARVPRRHRAHLLADRAARPARRLCLGGFADDHVHYVPFASLVPARPTTWWPPAAASTATRRALQRAGDGPVHRHGRRRRACARSRRQRQRAADRHRGPAPAGAGQHRAGGLNLDPPPLRPHSAAVPIRPARRRRLASEITGSRLSRRQALPPRMLRLASLLRTAEMIATRRMMHCRPQSANSKLRYLVRRGSRLRTI